MYCWYCVYGVYLYVSACIVCIEYIVCMCMYCLYMSVYLEMFLQIHAHIHTIQTKYRYDANACMCMYFRVNTYIIQTAGFTYIQIQTCRVPDVPSPAGLIPSPTHQWRRPRVTMKDRPLHSSRLGSGRISPSNQGEESRDSSIRSCTGVTRSSLSRSPRAPQGPPSRWLHTARCMGEADAPPPA